MHFNLAAAVSLGVTVIVAGVTLLMVVETRQLMRLDPPITTLTRSLVLRFPVPALAILNIVIFVVGLLTAHFAWDAACG